MSGVIVIIPAVGISSHSASPNAKTSQTTSAGLVSAEGRPQPTTSSEVVNVPDRSIEASKATSSFSTSTQPTSITALTSSVRPTSSVSPTNSISGLTDALPTGAVIVSDPPARPTDTTSNNRTIIVDQNGAAINGSNNITSTSSSILISASSAINAAIGTTQTAGGMGMMSGTRILTGAGNMLPTGQVDRPSTSPSSAEMAAAGSPGTSILNPQNRLFPLGVAGVALGGLFFLATVFFLIIKFSGCTKSRRYNKREPIPSFIDTRPPDHFGSSSSSSSSSFLPYETSPQSSLMPTVFDIKNPENLEKQIGHSNGPYPTRSNSQNGGVSGWDNTHAPPGVASTNYNPHPPGRVSPPRPYLIPIDNRPQASGRISTDLPYLDGIVGPNLRRYESPSSTTSVNAHEVRECEKAFYLNGGKKEEMKESEKAFYSNGGKKEDVEEFEKAFHLSYQKTQETFDPFAGAKEEHRGIVRGGSPVPSFSTSRFDPFLDTYEYGQLQTQTSTTKPLVSPPRDHIQPFASGTPLKEEARQIAPTNPDPSLSTPSTYLIRGFQLRDVNSNRSSAMSTVSSDSSYSVMTRGSVIAKMMKTSDAQLMSIPITRPFAQKDDVIGMMLGSGGRGKTDSLDVPKEAVSESGSERGSGIRVMIGRKFGKAI